MSIFVLKTHWRHIEQNLTTNLWWISTIVAGYVSYPATKPDMHHPRTVTTCHSDVYHSGYDRPKMHPSYKSLSGWTTQPPTHHLVGRVVAASSVKEHLLAPTPTGAVQDWSPAFEVHGGTQDSWLAADERLRRRNYRTTMTHPSAV